MGSKEVFQEIKRAIIAIYGEQESAAIAHRILDLIFEINKLDFLLNKSVKLPNDWNESILRLQSGEPFQYVFGKEYFRNLPIGLNKSTLIPRPETEELVDLVLHDIKKRTKSVRILDIGTGSGCIPLAIKKEFEEAEVVGWDVAESALQQAKVNAEHLQLLVQFQQQDLFEWEQNLEKWDVIISNPPYVLESEKQEIMPHVLNHEPALALFVPDEDPLLFYKIIAEMAKNRLNDGGSLFFEINQAFGKEVQEMLENKGFKYVEVMKDFRGKDRMVVGMREKG